MEFLGILTMLLSTHAESQGIYISTGTRFGLEGVFDRYLRLPFILPGEALRQAFSAL